MRYTKNLKVEGDKVYSYDTHVATMSGDKLLVHGYWSVTTSKHINHVADVYGLTTVKENREVTNGDKVVERDSDLKRIAMVAKLGDIFGRDQKEKNDWKARMLKAGLENRGLIMPDDWDTLSEEDKETRLNGAIEQLK